MGIKEQSRSIGPWAMLEDAKELEDDQAMKQACGLIGLGQGQMMMSR